MNGFANILYWGQPPFIGSYYNIQELNTFPFNTLNFEESEFIIRVNFGKIKLSYEEIIKVREIKKPFRRIQIIGNLNGKGYRLHYFPFSMKALKNELKKRNIEVQETVDWYTRKKSDEDRETYCIPEYPSGG